MLCIRIHEPEEAARVGLRNIGQRSATSRAQEEIGSLRAQ
jgi:hypothetical protein